ncbi:hypothetical protein [Yersinia enterocolitica]|uniref:hypothetical protein n=1 Tax=Yersinia enterocolitica TaxID=630 RepID=UPI001C60A49D|nr:hypothetical protein [Yersinia enterocolitica]MBW5820570.1 hypothetical protein [Yersinia enterocolitica]
MSDHCKERPILFNAEMVNAILSGRKTQTRRIMRDQPEVIPPEDECGVPGYWIPYNAGKTMVRNEMMTIACPLGMRGDQLWVRETWAVSSIYDGCPPRDINPGSKPGWCGIRYAASHEWIGIKGRPSIHMPRWASRINLKITDVRVERLNNISEENAKAEGAQKYDISRFTTDEINLLDAPLKNPDTPYTNGFALLWESCYGSGSWAANPFVWVIGFEKIN